MPCKVVISKPHFEILERSERSGYRELFMSQFIQFQWISASVCSELPYLNVPSSYIKLVSILLGSRLAVYSIVTYGLELAIAYKDVSIMESSLLLFELKSYATLHNLQTSRSSLCQDAQPQLLHSVGFSIQSTFWHFIRISREICLLPLQTF